MATIASRPIRRPAVDEWGVYDPQQAGLAALFAKLDAKKTPEPPDARTQLASAPEPAGPTLRDAK
jgi:hypothetical protein